MDRRSEIRGNTEATKTSPVIDLSLKRESLEHRSLDPRIDLRGSESNTIYNGAFLSKRVTCNQKKLTNISREDYFSGGLGKQGPIVEILLLSIKFRLSWGLESNEQFREPVAESSPEIGRCPQWLLFLLAPAVFLPLSLQSRGQNQYLIGLPSRT